jgi:WD40 repeat protein
LLKLYCKRVVGTLGNKILKFGEQSNKEDGECIVRRKIPKTPYKILDAPALKDDFYLNLVDWSSTDNLAVSLGACVYLWSAATSKVTKLC